MNIKSIVINATATKYGGALTILKEYLSEIKENDVKSAYYVFCGIDLDEFISDNIRVIKIRTSGFGIGGLKRFLWDLFSYVCVLSLFARSMFCSLAPQNDAFVVFYEHWVRCNQF